jgi:hypothetical protein
MLVEVKSLNRAGVTEGGGDLRRAVAIGARGARSEARHLEKIAAVVRPKSNGLEEDAVDQGRGVSSVNERPDTLGAFRYTQARRQVNRGMRQD